MSEYVEGLLLNFDKGNAVYAVVFDLSKALFIFSYNDESKINPILRDRMYRISTKGYKKEDKNVMKIVFVMLKK